MRGNDDEDEPPRLPDNPNPTVYKQPTSVGGGSSGNPNEFVFPPSLLALLSDTELSDDLDANEVFQYICNLRDPEHPYTLGQLRVVDPSSVCVEDGCVRVFYTPTIPHCSQATLIGLMIRVALMRSLPPRLKIEVQITDGTHDSEGPVNKQLQDKERVAAALENPNLLRLINNGTDLGLVESQIHRAKLLYT